MVIDLGGGKKSTDSSTDRGYELTVSDTYIIKFENIIYSGIGYAEKDEKKIS